MVIFDRDRTELLFDVIWFYVVPENITVFLQ